MRVVGLPPDTSLSSCIVSAPSTSDSHAQTTGSFAPSASYGSLSRATATQAFT